ncbi:uncharacterized protein Triagg1_4277 [Trichoderma aggressivum f. europaeum]|uniref:Uncharacterized protein n=1 Tax=Trichoderma aggressivum f. europaeum TaxID=173218 RepID=A0AAE1M1G2_9HYPO|nr:hypothetical protein Triagg1_4277 [Trichoderma aggressivum f. europaeum]
MIFPIFNMPCLHSHHQPPHNHYSRDSHDGEISSSAAIGLAVGLTLIAVVVAALVYCWCWRQQDRHKKHRKQSSHHRENHVTIANGTKTSEKQTQQRQDGSTQTEQVPPLPKVPLSIHHHQHDDKHFHGDHYREHLHEGDHILDLLDHRNDYDAHGDSHQSSHGHHRHRHRQHRFHRTHQILLPRDPIAEFEKLISPLSPGIPDAARADLEAILNGLDIPLPNDPVRVNVDEEEAKERRKKKHHRHHHHSHRRCHRHKRVTVH